MQPFNDSTTLIGSSLTVPQLKPILICADDFGMAPGINAGIIALARQGHLSATSCMSRGRYFAQDAQALAGLPVQTGLHLNLTESLTGGEFYQPLPRLLRNSYLRRLDAETLRRSIEGQFDAFEQALGRLPDYVDGHQHVHQFPRIRDCLLAVMRRRFPRQRPWLRSTRPGSLAGLPLKNRGKAWFIGALGARVLSRLASAGGFSQNRRLLGVYDFSGGRAHYGQLLERWLAGAEANDLIMCHPAQFADPGDPLGTQRVAEYAVLSDSDFPARLAGHGLSLSALPPRTTQPGTMKP
jgi:predicted glycoside hydrolase/deacetylase ChbG (UPF0249 family)